MKLFPSEIQDCLNWLAETTGLDAQGAANVWAGTTRLDLVGALNAKNGTVGLGLNAVCNALASTTGLDAQAALRSLTGYDGTSPLTEHPTLTVTPAEGEIDLSWTAVTNAAYYTVYKGRHPSTEDPLLNVYGTSYTDTDTLDSDPYFYRVVATISVFDSPSNEDSGSPLTDDIRITEDGEWRVTMSNEARSIE